MVMRGDIEVDGRFRCHGESFVPGLLILGPK